MGRARPLLLAITAQRRREEEMQRGPGVIPNGGQGAHSRMSGNDGERVPGSQNNLVFLGRSRSFPAQADVPNIRRQPHTQPHCLALGSRFQSQSRAPPPIFLKIITLPHLTPIFSHPHPQTLPLQQHMPLPWIATNPTPFLCKQAKVLIRVRRL